MPQVDRDEEELRMLRVHRAQPALQEMLVQHLHSTRAWDSLQSTLTSMHAKINKLLTNHVIRCMIQANKCITWS